MLQTLFTLEKKRALTRDVFEMTLSGDTSAMSRPGQFTDVRVEGKFLRRPFSVCDWDDAALTVVFRAVGDGTRRLASLAPGARLDLLTGLGNGFDADRSGASPLLIGGGSGVSPLYGLCRRLIAAGKRPRVFLGFGTSADVFYADEFRALGASALVATADGSAGERGLVTDIMPQNAEYFYACGPEAMLRAVCGALDCGGEASLEARMGCGFGACMGCTRMTPDGPKRVCRDGPVFRKEELIWTQE